MSFPGAMDNRQRAAVLSYARIIRVPTLESPRTYFWFEPTLQPYTPPASAPEVSMLHMLYALFAPATVAAVLRPARSLGPLLRRL